MAIKKVTYEFDPFELAGVEAPTGRKLSRALDAIAEFVEGETLNYIAEGKSPVSGGAWKRTLSKEYKERKVAQGGSNFANMELDGDLLDGYQVKRKGDKIVAGWEGSEAPKADGHNNFSGKSELPPRESVPNEKKNQTYKRDILRGIKQIAEEFAEEES